MKIAPAVVFVFLLLLLAGTCAGSRLVGGQGEPDQAGAFQLPEVTEPAGAETGLLPGTLSFPERAPRAPAADSASPEEASYGFVWALPESVDIMPAGIATDRNNNIYATDTVNSSIGKFTKDGTRISQWGTDGTRNGQFRNPRGIAVNRSMYMYIADTGNSRIQVLNPFGRYLRQWGTPGSGDGNFSLPWDIATDSITGTVYVADAGNNRVQVFTPDGMFVRALNRSGGGSGSGPGEFNLPMSVAVNGSGYVYVADTGNNRVQVLDPDGVFVMTWGASGSEAGNFSLPRGIETDSRGYVYVADTNNNRVQVFTPDGTVVRSVGRAGTGSGQLSFPAGIALKNNRFLLVSDSGNNRIQEFSQAGVYVTQWGAAGTAAAKFNNPSGIAINRSGYGYIADSGNNRIQVLSPDGMYVAQWGSSGTAARKFSRPGGIAVNRTDYVYVADTLNCRIQVFDLNGRFVRRWGTPGEDFGEFLYPAAVAASGSGYIYVADSSNHRIQVFDPGGRFVAAWNRSGGGAGSLPGEFNTPMGIAIGSSGHVFVSDTWNDRVQVFTAGGTLVRAWNRSGGGYGSGSGEFSYPTGIAVNSSGFAFVADSDNNRVQVFSPGGEYAGEWGSRGTDRGQFSMPAGIAADSAGGIWIADTKNHRIARFHPLGIRLGAPGAGGSWKRGSAQTITWTFAGSPGSGVRIELLRGGRAVLPISESTATGSRGAGSFGWVVPFNQTLADNYRIRITSTSDAAYTDTSDADFQISAGAPVTVETPDGGEEWVRGSARTITWRYTGFLVSAVRIELRRGTDVALVITPSTPVGAEGSGSYTWTIPPKLKPGSYRIRINSTASDTIADLSNDVFTIRAA